MSRNEVGIYCIVQLSFHHWYIHTFHTIKLFEIHCIYDKSMCLSILLASLTNIDAFLDLNYADDLNKKVNHGKNNLSIKANPIS